MWLLRCREAGTYPANPYHKDAACPPEKVRATRFDKIFEDDVLNDNKTDAFYTRLCDFVTFAGDPYDNVTQVANPVLDNYFVLEGALVNSFNPTPASGGDSYIDLRMFCRGGTTIPVQDKADRETQNCDGDSPVTNPMAEVRPLVAAGAPHALPDQQHCDRCMRAG